MKNAGLLYKWWWRYSAEDNLLWKRIVRSCKNDNSERIIILDPLNKKNAGSWQSICSIGKVNKDVEQVTRNGLCIVVGNGQRTLFWEDLWLSDKKKIFQGYMQCPLKNTKKKSKWGF